MRQFIRHPSDVPTFSSDTPIEPESFISFRIPYVRPEFEVAAARVAWCREDGNQYSVGVQFPDSDEAFRVRMVEQICHIDSYRRSIEEQEGRKLSGEEAAREWITRYSSSFPNP